MNPPTWLDERGQPCPKLPVRGAGGRQLWSTVESCGHRVEGIPVPDADGRWRLIVVEGEAT